MEDPVQKEDSGSTPRDSTNTDSSTFLETKKRWSVIRLKAVEDMTACDASEISDADRMSESGVYDVSKMLVCRLAAVQADEDAAGEMETMKSMPQDAVEAVFSAAGVKFQSAEEARPKRERRPRRMEATDEEEEERIRWFDAMEEDKWFDCFENEDALMRRMYRTRGGQGDWSRGDSRAGQDWLPRQNDFNRSESRAGQDWSRQMSNVSDRGESSVLGAAHPSPRRSPGGGDWRMGGEQPEKSSAFAAYNQKWRRELGNRMNTDEIESRFPNKEQVSLPKYGRHADDDSSHESPRGTSAVRELTPPRNSDHLQLHKPSYHPEEPQEPLEPIPVGANAYVVSKPETRAKPANMLRSVNVILNKVAPQTMDILSCELKELFASEVETEADMDVVCKAFVRKAMFDVHYIETYAEIAFNTREAAAKQDEKREFAQALLEQVEKQLERMLPSETEDEDGKAHLERMGDKKKECLGLATFSSTLLKHTVIDLEIFESHLNQMMKGDRSELAVEMLIEAFSSAGEMLDDETLQKMVDYFKELEDRSCKRVQFQIRDALEMAEVKFESLCAKRKRLEEMKAKRLSRVKAEADAEHAAIAARDAERTRIAEERRAEREAREAEHWMRHEQPQLPYQVAAERQSMNDEQSWSQAPNRAHMMPAIPKMHPATPKMHPATPKINRHRSSHTEDEVERSPVVGGAGVSLSPVSFRPSGNMNMYNQHNRASAASSTFRVSASLGALGAAPPDADGRPSGHRSRFDGRRADAVGGPGYEPRPKPAYQGERPSATGRSPQSARSPHSTARQSAIGSSRRFDSTPKLSVPNRSASGTTFGLPDRHSGTTESTWSSSNDGDWDSRQSSNSYRGSSKMWEPKKSWTPTALQPSRNRISSSQEGQEERPERSRWVPKGRDQGPRVSETTNVVVPETIEE